MRLLFCCEFYSPSVGGVQEVMRQIAERMVRRGHEVTLATTWLPQRDFTELNGVRVEGFAASGNLVRGMTGEVDRYRRFVTGFPADAILINAAQQWTFDALWPELDRIVARKVLIPCGFSGLFEPAYQDYFARMPEILAKFDHLVFHAQHYRDVDFARRHRLTNWSVIPNGADEREFAATGGGRELRERLQIPQDTFVFMTVGSLTGAKGHGELAAAYAKLDSRGRSSCLVLNGNAPSRHGSVGRALTGAKTRLAKFLRRSTQSTDAGRARITFKSRNAVFLRFHAPWVLHALGYGHLATGIPSIGYSIRQAKADPLKRVIRCDLPRADVVKLFQASNLFVFASNIEYSPLVLYESAAAGTPFLTVPVGNAEEIADWTGGGILCPAPVDARGMVRADPAVLAKAMADAMADRERLARLGANGRHAWQQHFTWDILASAYEAVLNPGKAPARGKPTGGDRAR